MTASRPQHEFYTLLRKHAVPFVVIGGHAVQFHGYVRTTEDVDLIWIRSDESELRLADALREANAGWISNERDPQTGIEKLVPVTLSHIRSRHLMMLCTDYGFVDLFDYIPGLPVADVGEVDAHGVGVARQGAEIIPHAVLAVLPAHVQVVDEVVVVAHFDGGPLGREQQHVPEGVVERLQRARHREVLPGVAGGRRDG